MRILSHIVPSDYELEGLATTLELDLPGSKSIRRRRRIQKFAFGGVCVGAGVSLGLWLGLFVRLFRGLPNDPRIWIVVSLSAFIGFAAVLILFHAEQKYWRHGL